MQEYEYSFKVEDITPYINYCKENNYKKNEESRQTRTLYRNDNKTIARVTTKEKNRIEETVLDFKDDNDSDAILKVSRETIPLVITEENKEAIYSILDMLGYKKDKVLKRKRYVYTKENVTFELDEYLEPEVMFVVGIEGKRKIVDNVYNELKKFENKI